MCPSRGCQVSGGGSKQSMVVIQQPLDVWLLLLVVSMLLLIVGGLAIDIIFSYGPFFGNLCCCCCCYSCTFRDISKLSVFNILGVGAIMLLAATAGLLGITALVTGAAHAPPAGDNQERGRRGRGCFLAAATCSSSSSSSTGWSMLSFTQSSSSAFVSKAPV